MGPGPVGIEDWESPDFRVLRSSSHWLYGDTEVRRVGVTGGESLTLRTGVAARESSFPGPARFDLAEEHSPVPLETAAMPAAVACGR